MRTAGRRGWVLALTVLAGLGSGCGLLQRRGPALPAVVIPQPPILLMAADAAAGPMAPPAVLTPIANAPAPRLAPVSLGPPPRTLARRQPGGESNRGGERAAAAGGEHAPDSPDLQLSTNLTPAQQAANRRSTLALLAQTQRELQLLNARRDLNAEGTATRAQVGEYVRQAREALNQGDLVRAQTLAVKAETLAHFLLGN